MSGPRFLFIRHGETAWNVEGRLQGGRDTPLNARGARQATEAGRRALALLRRAGRAPHEVTFVASPLDRARQTMAGLRRAMGLPDEGYIVDERLAELSFGAWEGLTWPEVKQQDPEAVRARRQDLWCFVPPGGESYAGLAARLRPWLDTVVEEPIVVSHGGVARALMVLAGGVPAPAAPRAAVLQGRVLRFAAGGCAWH